MISLRRIKEGGLEGKLSNPRYYRESIEKLHKKYSYQTQHKLYELQKEGYNFVQAYMDRKRLSRLLAKAVSSQSHQFSPARIVEILTEEKKRSIYSFSIIDRIIHGAIYLMLYEDYAPSVPDNLYSYIKGRDRYQAILSFCKYIKSHRRIQPVIKSRGIYVLRGDISSYGESIPVAPNTELWQQLNQFFYSHYYRQMSSIERKLLSDVIRPVMCDENGAHYEFFRGIPDGSPISALLLNLYASPIDKALSNIPGAFYARYGDDILFAHTDIEVFRYGEGILKNTTSKLSLTLNPRKTKRLYFNGAGRSGHGMKGLQHIDFLGLTVGFDNTISLKAEKVSKLYGDIKHRLYATSKLMRKSSFDEEGEMLCSVVNDALDEKAIHGHAYASVLMKTVDDRKQLRQIDYNIARLISKIMLGHSSVKGFRTLPYSKMRQEWKLRSLEYDRNHH